MRKLKASTVAQSVAKRLVHPGHLIRAVKLQRARKRTKVAFADAELALFAQIMPTGFLHFGYFDDVDRCPEEMSLAEVRRAQIRYAEVLLEHAHDRSAPVLDIGCGMGGLCRMLGERGFSPVALTPDRIQAEHIRRTYPHVPIIESKFERLPEPDAHEGKYGTVFTSESLQYLKLDAALPLMTRILKPHGTWIACDFFATAEGGARGGHPWEEFERRLADQGWEIAYQRDITANILPTLKFIHMWASEFGLPLMQFGLHKLRTKSPGLHYVLEDVLEKLDGVIEDNLKVVDPADFAAKKKYMLLVMKRRAASAAVSTAEPMRMRATG